MAACGWETSIDATMMSTVAPSKTATPEVTRQAALTAESLSYAAILLYAATGNQGPQDYGKSLAFPGVLVNFSNRQLLFTQAHIFIRPCRAQYTSCHAPGRHNSRPAAWLITAMAWFAVLPSIAAAS